MQVFTEVDCVWSTGVGHRRTVLQAYVDHQGGKVRFRRHVVVGNSQRCGVLAKVRISVAYRHAHGIQIEGHPVVVEVPLVKHNTPVRATVERLAAAETDCFRRRCWIGIGRRRGHRPIIEDCEHRRGRMRGTQGIGHAQANGVGRGFRVWIGWVIQAKALERSPGNGGLRAVDIMVLAVAVQIPRVRVNFIALGFVWLPGSRAVQCKFLTHIDNVRATRICHRPVVLRPDRQHERVARRRRPVGYGDRD